jgi:hypothetical protein
MSDAAFSFITGEPWATPAWINQTRVILDSFRRLLGRDLIPPGDSPLETSKRLFEAPFVVVAHGTETDPVLNYANRTAVNLWQMPLDELLRTPSRKTAEPMHRDERARMLARTAEQGYIDDYAGVRVSATGRRFRIRNAIVWNLTATDGSSAGQAATFKDWEFLPPQ